MPEFASKKFSKFSREFRAHVYAGNIVMFEVTCISF
jgi:hypothetical protein